MREHQIAISLKPQQFEILQKLARERGFKSVTAYIKQKIVELALGMDGVSADGQASGSGALGALSGEGQHLLVELDRIHQELRSFIDDGPDDEEFFAVGDPAPVTGLLESSPPGHLGSDYSGTGARSNTQSSGASVVPAEGVSTQVLPSNNLGGFGFRLGGFSTAGAGTRFQPPVENNDRLSNYREIMDDLEELADRAFAISPRLGALDENAPAEEATSRGARNAAAPAPSASESIFVEPILPTKSAAEARSTPISMVPPVTAKDLPGPGEIETSKSLSSRSAPAPVVQNVVVPQAPVPAPAPAPAQAQSQVPSASIAKPVRNTEPAPAPVVEPVSARVSAPQPAVEDISPEPESAPKSEPSPEPPPEPEAFDVTPPPPPPAPMPGDDLLADLLDESLVAHAVSPREGENVFAVNLGFDQVATAGGVMQNVAAPPFVDPDGVEDAESGHTPTADMGQEPYQQTGVNAQQEPLSTTAASQADTGPNDVATDTQAPRPYNDVARSNIADPTTIADVQEPQRQDPGTGGPSNMSGGPPPRRRRS